MPKKDPPVVGNPLWLEWVEKLMHDAEDKGSRAADTYKKAAKSLRQCPITYQHPEEAAQLVGIGVKIVEVLKRKTKEYYQGRGQEMPERPAPTRAAPKPRAKGKGRAGPTSDEEAEQERARFDKRARLMSDAQRALSNVPLATPAFTGASALPPPPPVGRALGGGAGGPATDQRRPPTAAAAAAAQQRASANSSSGGAPRKRLLSPNSSDNDNAHEPAKRKGSSKAYVPKLGSGSYAILLSLYNACSSEDHKVWCTKNKITTYGTQFSSTSFEVAAKGSAYHYTAWNSMTGLVKKELVVVENTVPKRWALTTRGFDLAEMLVKQRNQDLGGDLEVHRRLGEDEGPWIVNHGNAVASGSGSRANGGVARQQPHRRGGFDFLSDNDNDDGEDFGFDRNGYLAPSSSGSAPRSFVAAAPRLAAAALAAEEQEERDLEEALRRSMEDVGNQPARSAAPCVQAIIAASKSRVATAPIPLPRTMSQPLAVPSSKSRERDLFSSSSAPSSSGGGLGSGPLLEGRKAALGLYASHSKAVEEEPRGLGRDGPFEYYYLTMNGERVKHRVDAEIGQEDGGSTIYRIEYRLAQHLHQMRRSVIKMHDITERKDPLPGGSTKGGYLRERLAQDRCPGFVELEKEATKAKSTSGDPRELLQGKKKEVPKVDKSAMYYAPPGTTITGSLVDFSSSEPEDSHDAAPPPHSTASEVAKSMAASALPRSRSSGPAVPTSFDILPSYDNDLAPDRILVNRHPLDAVADHATVFPASFSVNHMTVRRGSFKVVLVVDTRETGETRTQIVDLLGKAKVPVDRKMLPLGDMVWVARRVFPDGTPTGEDDIVLDAIVERKRLDDLCSSIKDGRYTEQKVRMKDSAISHRIYLIEAYNAAHSYQTFGPQLWTAKSQLQINDGFYVHESNNVRDTVHYLTLRTQVMRELYENTDLKVIPDSYIDRQSYLGLQKHLRARHPSSTYLTSYNMFEEINKIDAALTVRRQWASMILRVSGVSAEKAVPFVERWATPHAFFTEALAHTREVEEENAEKDAAGVQKTGRGVPKRRKAEDFVMGELGDDGPRAIKGKLGTKLYDLFMAQGQYKD